MGRPQKFYNICDLETKRENIPNNSRIHIDVHMKIYMCYLYESTFQRFVQ